MVYSHLPELSKHPSHFLIVLGNSPAWRLPCIACIEGFVTAGTLEPLAMIMIKETNNSTTMFAIKENLDFHM